MRVCLIRFAGLGFRDSGGFVAFGEKGHCGLGWGLGFGVHGFGLGGYIGFGVLGFGFKGSGVPPGLGCRLRHAMQASDRQSPGSSPPAKKAPQSKPNSKSSTQSPGGLGDFGFRVFRVFRVGGLGWSLGSELSGMFYGTSRRGL